MSKQIVLLTGPPGAGKGTQARIIATNHDWYTFSIGQLLRDKAAPETKALMNEGHLLPAEEVVDLVTAEIAGASRPVLVDGFPRRLDQAEAFDDYAREHFQKLPTVLFISIDQQRSWQRLADRGRQDDERSVWEERWSEYEEQTVAAIDYYRRQYPDRLVEVDGSGDVAAVSQAIEEALHATEN